MKRLILLALREKLNLTQEQVAKQAGINRSYYGLIENGERNPSLRNAQQIAKTLEVSLDIAFADEVFFNGKCYDTKLNES